MRRRTAEALLAWLRGRQEAMVRLLEELVLAESPSNDRHALAGPRLILGRELEALGYLTRTVDGGGFGDHLYARPRERLRRAGHQLLVGHVDTVWPVGTVDQMPVRHADGELFGPGSYDMKGGLVEIVFALRALAVQDLMPAITPVVFVNADEEVGSVDSRRHISRLARGATQALVLEGAAGREGRLKTARKGSGRFSLVVHGRAAHAGSSPEQGVSAILELSEQIRRLNELNDAGRGVTVNVGMVDGGMRPNVVAPRASAEIDVRVPTAGAARRTEEAIRSLRATLPGASIVIAGGFRREPMEHSAANRELFRHAQELATLLGYRVEDAGIVGGSSDANITSPYTPTLDGLGPIGDGAHAADEHVLVSSLAERAALLALLLLEPVRGGSATSGGRAPSVPARRPRARAPRAPARACGAPTRAPGSSDARSPEASSSSPRAHA